MDIKKLIWDDWNISHIKKHNVTPAQIEKLFGNQELISLKAKDGKIMIIGKIGTRILTVVLSNKLEKVEGSYYVVSGRDSSKKERIYFRKQTQ